MGYEDYNIGIYEMKDENYIIQNYEVKIQDYYVDKKELRIGLQNCIEIGQKGCYL